MRSPPTRRSAFHASESAKLATVRGRHSSSSSKPCWKSSGRRRADVPDAGASRSCAPTSREQSPSRARTACRRPSPSRRFRAGKSRASSTRSTASRSRSCRQLADLEFAGRRRLNLVFLVLGPGIQALCDHSSPKSETPNDDDYTEHIQVGHRVTGWSEKSHWEDDKHGAEGKQPDETDQIVQKPIFSLSDWFQYLQDFFVDREHR